MNKAPRLPEDRIFYVRAFITNLDSIVRDIVGHNSLQCLSDKELKVIYYTILGYDNKAIGKRIDTTFKRVKIITFGIFDKLGVSSRLELGLFVVNHPALARVIVEMHDKITKESQGVINACISDTGNGLESSMRLEGTTSGS